MDSDVCNVCGCSGTNLVDGFYYCIECGTQNQNVQETVVDTQLLADGSVAIATKKRVHKVPKKVIEMSGEWYKWHALNFILFGMAEQVVQCGANPSFKTKLLWIWVRYMKKFQNKAELGKTIEGLEDPSIFVEEDPEVDSEADDALPEDKTKKKRANKKNPIDLNVDLSVASKGLLLTMLYLALNLDRSHIQLSHLYRFIRENRLNMRRLLKFVPKDINVKNIPHWYHFKTSKPFQPHWTRAVGCALLTLLDLGPPETPNFREMVDNHFIELRLPNHLKTLVYSLIHLHSYRYLNFSLKNFYSRMIPRIPNYECVIMAYIIVALKMCFGLDCVYEEKISNTVDKINNETGYPKSYKYRKYSNTTDRLFSLREWCDYLVFRKIMLCKYCLYMAEQHSLDVDDYVNMEHMEERVPGKVKISDEITMDLLNKIPLDNNVGVIPKSEFRPSCTPMADYLSIIKEHCQDPEVKQLLSEDFTQYSLKYACQDLELIDPDSSENVIKGATKDKKIFHNKKMSLLKYAERRKQKVYVKICDNKNWLNTNRPTIEHVEKLNGRDGKGSDNGTDSGSETNDRNTDFSQQKNAEDSRTGVDEGESNGNETGDENCNPSLEDEQKCNSNVDNNENKKIIKEEDENENIFGDSFEYIDIEKKDNNEYVEDYDCVVQNKEVEQVQNESFLSDSDNANQSDSDASCASYSNFNPATFDREAIIRELVLAACKKIKCPVPIEYRPWKSGHVVPPPRTKDGKPYINTGNSGIRRKQILKEIEGILDCYTERIQGDFLNKLEHEVNLAVRNATLVNLNTTVEQSDNLANGTIENIDDEPNVSVLSKADQTPNPADGHKEINEKTESKLFENEQMKLDDLMPKSESKFDEKKFNINQMYLKIDPREVDKILESVENDPELEEILKVNVNKDVRSLRLPSIRKRLRAPSESEDELPLNEIQKRIKLHKEILSEEEKLEHLIEKDKISEFKYAIRHYYVYRHEMERDVFDDILEDNVSLLFVMRECASVLDCTVYEIYKHVQRIEEFMKNT